MTVRSHRHQAAVRFTRHLLRAMGLAGVAAAALGASACGGKVFLDKVGEGDTGGAGGAGGAGGGQAADWRREPARVFDNLYFVGMTEFSTWAVTTSEGIIVIDPVFDYSVEEAVVGGLRKLGLDPADIRYVIVSHGHGDHAGGAKFLQDSFGARVLLGAADWDLLEGQQPTWLPLKRVAFPYMPAGQNDDRTFFRYKKDSELARAGANGEPVGAPPVD